MTVKQKVASVASAFAVTTAVATGAYLLSNNDETITPEITQYEEHVENNEGNITYDEEALDFYNINDETETTDILEQYRTSKEVDGTILHYYNDVPFELQGELLNYRNGGDSFYSDTQNTYELSDISVMSNYIFVNTADGLKYLSDISNGNIIDSQIDTVDFKGFNVFINSYLEGVDNFTPFENFNGLFYGNKFSFFIDNYLFKNFGGKIENITISSPKPIAEFSSGGEIIDCNFYIEGTSYNNGIVGQAENVKVRNTFMDCNLSGANVGGIFGIASGECDITNCIVNGTINSDSTAGSFIGRLNNQITFKNNVANTTVEAVIGYGGKAVGYADYEYHDDIDKVNGAYCETALTVEGLPSELYIGNVSENPPKLVEKYIYGYEDITEETYKNASTTTQGKNGEVITVYNLALIPSEYPVLKEYIKDTYYVAEFDENAPKLEGFYDFKDLIALNQFATANDLKKFFEEEGYIYFEDEEAETADIYFDSLVYSSGDCIAFISGEFDGGTLIVASYIENQLNSITSHNITNAGTYFTSIEDSEDITEVKAFLWTSLDSLTPLCESKNVNVGLTMGVDEIEHN